MAETSKLTLSNEELQLVTNTGWILTKRTIIDKAGELLGAHAAFAQEHLTHISLPDAAKNSSPKIARGENYMQLPWVMLDYPRLFDKENIFAVRTFFWWGHFFSNTLHLGGSYKKQFEEKIIGNIDLLQQQQLWICINTNEWQHHFEEDNYKATTTLTKEVIKKEIQEKAFVKLAYKFPLQQWEQMHTLLQQSFITLLKLLAD